MARASFVIAILALSCARANVVLPPPQDPQPPPPAPTTVAVVEAEPHMDMYGIGLTRWQPDLAVPTAPGLGFDPDPDYLERYAMPS